MKVYDFTNGVKGKEVGFCRIAGSLHGWFAAKNGRIYKITLAQDREGWAWCEGAAYRTNGPDQAILPETFGVQAICFSTGETISGLDKGVWNWHVVGTADWNREAIKKGILNCEFSHLVPD